MTAISLLRIILEAVGLTLILLLIFYAGKMIVSYGYTIENSNRVKEWAWPEYHARFSRTFDREKGVWYEITDDNLPLLTVNNHTDLQYLGRTPKGYNRLHTTRALRPRHGVRWTHYKIL